ncbi:hypothetical protein [Mesorhizobium sp. WSM3859]|uniref:hypothetical protein n=1 Tax=Mesorhizobium sp. WSM3859 TaxID=2029402 RepID=UPI000BAEF335|nr:hypothetical protein [Mesorhizobium sp. WSM3859]PBC09193.1 hypothetical protein CK230_17060 [Mesorhizobium sp. WSM3859]
MANLVRVKLADETHRLPHPFRPNTDFPADGLIVDAEDPVWMQLLGDGSLILETPDEAPAVTPAKRKEKN